MIKIWNHICATVRVLYLVTRYGLEGAENIIEVEMKDAKREYESLQKRSQEG